MKIILSVSLLSVFFCLLPTQERLLGQGESTKANPRLLIAECAGDGFNVLIRDDGVREKIARIGVVDLEAAFSGQDDGAKFWFMRGKQEIFSFEASDLSSPSVWIAVDHDIQPYRHPSQAHIALTYSDGYELGGFHVRVFLIDADGVRDASTAIDGAVANYKSRHYCKTRGNNVTALKWMRGSLLLLTEVYPTSDCGPDVGHLEGYLVSVPEGKILEHLTLSQLQRYPGVCVENDDEN